MDRTVPAPAAGGDQPAAAQGDAGDIEAVLEGGPFDLPTALRRRRTAPSQGKIKIVYRGGYEHFERVHGQDGTPGSRPVVFSWICRTKMAE